MESQNNEYIKIIKQIENKHIAIFNVIKKCENRGLNTACFNDYLKKNLNLTKFLAVKMFEFGVGFGMELKNKSPKSFKW